MKSISMVSDFNHDIFILDDNSPDNTGKIIKNLYPTVNLIYGNGNLFWSKGTRKVWEHASLKKDYDFYVWLNDDVILFEKAFSIIYNDLKKRPDSILIGVFSKSKSRIEEITYGGRDENLNLLIPNGDPQKCLWMNGNFVFIPKKIYNEVGLLSKAYTHNYGDVDYGLRAIKKGFDLNISSQIIGTCEVNKIEIWRNPKSRFLERIKSFRKTKNFRLVEVIYFQFNHFGILGLLKYLSGIFIILLYPKLYYSFSNEIKGKKNWETLNK